MNKEGNWKDCIESSSSLKVSPDKSKAKSLIDTAKGRVDYLKNAEIKENSANYVFESYYSSVLEMLHAILILKGYKVSNHVCLGFYIRDVLKKADIFRVFDDCRFKRNSLIYYGRKMDFATAKKTIINCKKLIKDLEKLVNL